MKNKFFAFILVIALLFPFALASCDESQPLPEGVSAQPDMNASEFAASLDDGSGGLRWPAELVPDDFPVPDYTKIYSVSREDNALHVVMLGHYSMKKMRELASETDPTITPQDQYLAWTEAHIRELVPTDKLLVRDLRGNASYVQYRPLVFSAYNDSAFITRSGWQIEIYGSQDSDNVWLNEAAASWDGQYAWELVFRRIDTPDSYFWKYPDRFTDIGYPREGVIDYWPEEYVPEPLLDLNTKFDIMEIALKKTGVRVAIRGEDKAENAEPIFNYFSKAGFVELLSGVWVDKYGNYCYFYRDYPEEGNEPGFIIHMCKPNDKIDRGGGSE